MKDLHDIKNIEALLAEKKYDDVRTVLRAATDEKMTSLQKGAAFTGLASMYLDISNKINGQYLQALNEALAGLEALNLGQSKFNDKVRIGEVKESLGK